MFLGLVFKTVAYLALRQLLNNKNSYEFFMVSSVDSRLFEVT